MPLSIMPFFEKSFSWQMRRQIFFGLMIRSCQGGVGRFTNAEIWTFSAIMEDINLKIKSWPVHRTMAGFILGVSSYQEVSKVVSCSLSLASWPFSWFIIWKANSTNRFAFEKYLVHTMPWGLRTSCKACLLF